MVHEQLMRNGIRNRAILHAMQKVPRHFFVQEALTSQAYEDLTLPIGSGQTISRPIVVAWMTEILQPQKGLKILEIGTGCGYQTAVLAELGLNVFSIERIPELHQSAKQRLAKLGYTSNTLLKLSDGTLGWKEAAPFDRIMITAGGPVVPPPLLEQLADQGLLLMPIGNDRQKQNFILLHKNNGEITKETFGEVSFVELIGNHGW
ncbi:protein-L-isoaspartate(D-aspartate) O-methyltransferase [Desulfovibrio litoralis]